MGIQIPFPQTEKLDIFSYGFNKSLNKDINSVRSFTVFDYLQEGTDMGSIVNFGVISPQEAKFGQTLNVSGSTSTSRLSYHYIGRSLLGVDDLSIRPSYEDGEFGLNLGEREVSNPLSQNLRFIQIELNATDNINLRSSAIDLIASSVGITGQLNLTGDFIQKESVVAGEDVTVNNVVRYGNENQTNDYRTVSQTSTGTTKTLISGDNTPMPSGSARKVAQKIVFGTVSERLKQVTINVDAINNGNANTWAAMASLYSDTSNAPGTLIASTAENTTLGSSTGEKTFVFTTPQTLSVNTTYWIVIEWSGVDTNNWGDEVSDSGTLSATGSTTGIFQGVSVSTDNGATWPAPSGDSLYIKLDYTDTTNRIYKTKATIAELVDTAIGVVVTAASQGDNASIVFNGRTGGSLSGLTSGRIYYVSDTRGDLGLTQGTVKRLVGTSLSATDMHVQVK